MVKILIVEDNLQKINDIRNLLESNANIDLEIATDIINANRYITLNQYDLLILDLRLPKRIGDLPTPENGKNFLEQIIKIKDYKKPFHIIGLTEYEEFKDDYKQYFNRHLWELIYYDVSSNDWQKKIIAKVDYLISSKQDLLNSLLSDDYDYDLGIVTALRSVELESILQLPGNWQSQRFSNDSTEYYIGTFATQTGKIRVASAAAHQMGMVASAVLTSKLIQHFRPKFLAMTGIAGGVNGIGNLGDVLIADISFDSGSGKIKTDHNGASKFEPDYKSIDLETDIKELLISCKYDNTLLSSIKKLWHADKPTAELDIHIGPFATGAGVIENNEVINQIKGNNRKLIGIDMETYGVMYTAKNCTKPRPKAAFSLKSISDFADPLKNDKFQRYAAFTSAQLLYHFVTQKLY